MTVYELYCECGHCSIARQGGSAFLSDCSLNRESIVDVYGLVVLSPEPVKSCTQSDVEVQVEKVSLLSAVRCMQPLGSRPFG